MSKEKKELTVILEHKGKIYASDVMSLTISELRDTLKIVEMAVDGKLSHFKITYNNREVYFPKDVLSESIITTVTE